MTRMIVAGRTSELLPPSIIEVMDAFIKSDLCLKESDSRLEEKKLLEEVQLAMGDEILDELLSKDKELQERGVQFKQYIFRVNDYHLVVSRPPIVIVSSSQV